MIAESAPVEPRGETAPKTPELRGRLLQLGQLSLAAGLAVYLFRSGRLELAALGGLAERWPWWLAALLAYGGAQGAMALRWYRLLRLARVPVRLRETAALTLIGLCASQIAPGATGGDVAKALLLCARERGRRGAVLVSIAADRLLGLFTLASCTALAPLAAWQIVRGQPGLHWFALGAAGGVAAAATGAAALAALPLGRLPGAASALAWLRARRWSAAPLEALAEYAGAPPRALLTPLLASCALNALMLTAHYCLGRALFGPALDARALLAVAPMAMLAGCLPLTPFGNAGVLEGLYAELLGLAGIGQGALFGLLLRSVVWSWALVGAALLAAGRLRAPRAALAPQPDA